MCVAHLSNAHSDNTNAGGDGGEYVDFADDANYMDPAQEEFDLMMKEVTEHLANSEHTANLHVDYLRYVH